MSAGAGGQDRAPSDRFMVVEATIPQLQEALATGRVSSRELVEQYLARIAAYDAGGAQLNAMIFINPKALQEADRLDAERVRQGPRGPLHGIPAVLKDNFDTFDMPTSAGSIALAGLVPPDDGFQVRKLRQAGVIFLGKTNMHELAYGITTISSLGGQSRNPYDPDRNPGGSSGGTGTAVAANLAAFGMGSDTCGSIRIPASHNNLVGLRVSQGLSSRDGIVPLSHTQDVGGPLARTVTDLALVLDATVGYDEADATTEASRGRIPESYTEFLNPEGLEKRRIGVLEVLFGETSAEREMGEVVREAIEAMRQQGAELVDIVITDLESLLDVGYEVETGEFRFDVERYLRETPGAPISSFAEIFEQGLYDRSLESVLRRTLALESLETEEYRQALAHRGTIRRAVEEVMDDQELEAIVYPTMRHKPAPIGERQQGTTCLLSALSGSPAISLPAGFTDDDLPVGMELLGRPFAEPTLLELSYAFEQATHHRRPPLTAPALVDGKAPGPSVWEIVATGEDVVPAVESSATAKARFELDPIRGELSYDVSVNGLLPSDILFAHLHRGASETNGPVLFLLSRATDRRFSGKLLLRGAILTVLIEGELYLSIHTSMHRSAELRAQLLPPS